MRIAHVTRSVTALGGGIPEVIRALSLAQESRGDFPRVYGLRDAGDPLRPWPAGCPEQCAGTRLPGFTLAPELSARLRDEDVALVQSHGLWSCASIAVPRWGRSEKRPWIVSPHGMLDPWALRRSPWKKQLAELLFERRHVHGAACLHALCQTEANSIRRFGVKTPICIIPNGVDLPRELCASAPGRAGTRRPEPGTRTLLFLGRLHPKKGLDRLLHAWKEVHSSIPGLVDEWQLVIVGWDQGGHRAQLERICIELGLAARSLTIRDLLDREPAGEECGAVDQGRGRVVFSGPAFGDEKDQILARADAFVLPSLSEGLPMSVLEAWAYGLPVLMTPECNLPEGFLSQAAVPVTVGDARDQGHCDSIATGLRTLFEMRDAERREMGRRGRELVEQRFTWPRVAAQLQEVYAWMVGGGPLPGTCDASYGQGQ